ncbi:AdoMet-homocysteine methyltransferase [Yamadazyma tenuis]|uniref:Homocysteine S-methyltransferase n=1 Tax=Candida tenuis (strain ATCC 10573 / BCRC 21748 / CBS 615 / JCM 9827 / NBRC 10315 / NRRL Y-1498 / VKM Y-70) TaxID=590646 RepID=G3BB61_CANTC|nr:Homocysteine S-methyltransferase [Yamadazyma tenuis ATCC 10573]EGV62147.1 Homocysteine S-methyltransferase [Yamadazyma tenuis ATCC 10573]WEJ93408.1 AdoMet-homocysteine methyltransferase [Yamadazyma tenuis]
MYVLDGALGIELDKLTPIRGTPLWAGHAVEESPDIVRQVHSRYIQAGCDIVSTATYQMSYQALRQTDHDDAGTTAAWKAAVDVVVQARDGAGVDRKILIAGTIGPYGCFVNDGSEYTGNYTDSPTAEWLAAHHRPLVEFLEKNGDVDVIAFETVPSAVELEAIVALDVQKPYWVSLCVNSSMDLVACAAVLRRCNSSLVAVGVNCVEYSKVSGYLEALSAVGVPLIAYPNYGYIYSQEDGYADLSDLGAWETAVAEWMKFDMWAIGGCCGTGAEEVSVVREAASRCQSAGFTPGIV